MITFLFTVLVCSVVVFLLFILIGIFIHISLYGARITMKPSKEFMGLLSSPDIARSDRLPTDLAVIFDHDIHDGISRVQLIPGVAFTTVYLIHYRHKPKTRYVTLLPFTRAAREIDAIFPTIPLFSQRHPELFS